MINLIICIMSNLFRVYLIDRFILIFLEKREENRKKTIIAFTIFFAVNTSVYLFFHLAWVNALCNLIGIGLAVSLYTESIKTNLFVTGFIYLIHMACDIMTVILFVDYKDGAGFDQVYYIITVLGIFLCERITETIVQKHRRTEHVQNMPLIFVPFFSILMASLLDYTNSITAWGFVIVCLGLLFINFFLFYLYNLLSDTLCQKYENEVLAQKISAYANQMDIMLQSEEKVKALRHDMKHHMSELKLMAIQGKNHKIQKYIDDMQEFMANPNETVSSGNWEIDSVLNYMLQQARKELTAVTIKVQLPEGISHSFDINVILGNLLENAIEGARQTEEKSLKASIQLKQGVLRIVIENSCNVPIRKGREGFLTTKKNKEFHGIGLGNVRKIVEKHNGIMEVSAENKVFCVRLILYMYQIQK